MSILTREMRSVRAASPRAQPRWQRELKEAVRDPRELCRRLRLPAALAGEAEGAVRQFALFVPPAYLARIRPGDPHDPLLRQVLPVSVETANVTDYSNDPVGDGPATLRPGVIQKYAGRALLVATGACAVHCRYCFRRHFPYHEVPHSDGAWDTALEAIASDPSIREVILSGGDPLTLVDERLATLAEKIAAIEHVTRLRVHTRLPIMIPSRVTDQLVQWLCGTRLTPIVVIHANHAQELDDDVAAALSKLRAAGVMLLNQAVLLRGVNNSVEAQQSLSERLVGIGVLPYYLHQLDRVAGAAHFEVSVDEGRRIVTALRDRLSGYAVPCYVQEVAGRGSKVALI